MSETVGDHVLNVMRFVSHRILRAMAWPQIRFGAGSSTGG